MLKVPPDPDQEAAGISMFDVYGIKNTVDSLSHGDILKHEAIYLQPYCIVFEAQRMNITKSVFNKAYQKVMERKNR